MGRKSALDDQKRWDRLARYHDYFLPLGFSVTDAEHLAALASKNLPADARILLVGCASGETLKPFRALGLNVIGIDQAPAMLCQGDGGAMKTAAQGDSLPFPNTCFHMVVVATGVIDHADNVQTERLLSECRRVLQPPGAVFLFRHAIRFEANRLYRLCRIINDRWFYPHRYGRLCKLLQRSGLVRRVVLFAGPAIGYRRLSVLLEEPVAMRKYAAAKGVSDPWKIYDLLPARVRRWTDEELESLFSYSGLVCRTRRVQKAGQTIMYALTHPSGS